MIRPLPFTSEILFNLFGQYNAAIWPAQIAAYVLGLLALALVFRPVPAGGRIAGAILAAFWLWNGIVYHWQFFLGINFLAAGFAPVFVLAGLLFAWTGLARGRIGFRFSPDAAGWAGLGLMVYGLAVYPLTNILAGHGWPEMPVFGVAPSPTTIFTLGLLLLAEGRTPWHLAVIPLLWTLIGGSTASMLGVPEDLALFVAGIVALVLIIWKNRRAGREGKA